MINIKGLLGVLGVSILMVCVFAGLWRYEVARHDLTKYKLTQSQGIIATHEQNTIRAERQNHEYQADINRLNADIKRLRSRPAKCKPATGSPAIHFEPGQGREYASHDGTGVDTGWLYNYAGEAERFRIERNACKSFVNDVVYGGVRTVNEK